MRGETIPPRVDLSRKPRDRHTQKRSGDEASGDDEWTLGPEVGAESTDEIPDGFHRPNVETAPAEPDVAKGHPNDPGGEAAEELTFEIEDANPPSDGEDPPVGGADADGPSSDEPAVELEAEAPADDEPQQKGKKAKKPKKAKKAKKPKGGKKSDDEDGIHPDAAGPLSAAEDAEEASEGPDQSTGEIVSAHRFGLRLGSHKAGNLLSKLKAKMSKAADPEEEAIRQEEEEATAERIEPDERYKEVETYPIHPPYAYVRILFDDERKDYIYQVLEPLLTKTEKEILDFIEHTLIDNLTVSPEQLEGADEMEFLTEQFNDVIFDYSVILHEDETEEEAIKKKLLYYLRRDFIGHGPIDILMNDPYIEDISCDGPHVPIFLYHRKYESMRSSVVFGEHDKLDAYVIKMAQRSGKHISIAEPILDATMGDGSRLQSTLGTEVSAGGSTFTIRKFRPDPFTPPDLVMFRTMSSEMLAYLWVSVQNGASIMYAGGTASGKTTSLNAILLFIPPNMKIVSIEDTREVNLPHENWIAGITRTGFGPRDQFGRQAGEIDMFQLLKNALRQRPEYIIVGEVRGQEAYSLFQAMATGHAAYGTMHADSVDAVIHRLESDPINIPRSLLEALDVVSVQIQTRVGGKRVRRTKQISEIVGLDPHTREILTNEVFRWVPKDDSFKFSGVSYILERIQLEKGMPAGSMVKELRRRAEIIEWMIKMHIQDYQDVSRVVSAYYKEPEIVLGIVRGDIAPDEAPAGLRQLAAAGGKKDDDPLSAATLAAVPGTESKDAAQGAPVQNVTAAAHPAAPVAAPETGAAEENGPQDEPVPEAAPRLDPDEAEEEDAPVPATSKRRGTDAAQPLPLAEQPPGWEESATEASEDGPPEAWGDPQDDDRSDEAEHPQDAHPAPDSRTAHSSRQVSPGEGEEWLRQVEEKIRARYEELEKEKKRPRRGDDLEQSSETGGEGN